MKKTIYLIFCLTLLCSYVNAENVINAGLFSKEDPGTELPEKWEPLTFKNLKNTDYRLIQNKDRMVVKAETDQSASGLIRKIEIDIEKYRIMEWSWMVENIYEKGNVREKSGDDYPARIYITFKYNPDEESFIERMKFKAAKALHGEYPPGSSINYIYESKEPAGTVVPNPYTERVIMYVVDSGEKNLKKWVTHKRNIYEDYINAFGKKPPAVTGVAIMSDSDNTRESAAAYYGDIIFRQEKY